MATLAVAAVSGVIALLTPQVPAPYLLVLYVLVVMAVAVVWGTGMAVFAAVLSVVLFNYLFVPPQFSFHFGDPSNIVGSVAFWQLRSSSASWRRVCGGRRWSRRASRRSS